MNFKQLWDKILSMAGSSKTIGGAGILSFLAGEEVSELTQQAVASLGGAPRVVQAITVVLVVVAIWRASAEQQKAGTK